MCQVSSIVQDIDTLLDDVDLPLDECTGIENSTSPSRHERSRSQEKGDDGAYQKHNNRINVPTPEEDLWILSLPKYMKDQQVSFYFADYYVYDRAARNGVTVYIWDTGAKSNSPVCKPQRIF